MRLTEQQELGQDPKKMFYPQLGGRINHDAPAGFTKMSKGRQEKLNDDDRANMLIEEMLEEDFLVDPLPETDAEIVNSLTDILKDKE